MLPVTWPFRVFGDFIPASAAVDFTRNAIAAYLINNATRFFCYASVTRLYLQINFIRLIRRRISDKCLVPNMRYRVIQSIIRLQPAIFPVISNPFRIIHLTMIIPEFKPTISGRLRRNFRVIVACLFPVTHLFIRGKG